MRTVAELEDIRDLLKDVFPDAQRGNKGNRWFKSIKVLHLDYYMLSDTVGGTIVTIEKDMFCYVEWDTNVGCEYIFAESLIENFVKRVKSMHKTKRHIARCITLPAS